MRPIGKLYQRPDIIFVGNFARWAICADSEVRPFAGCSEWTLWDESLAVAHQTLDGAGYHLCHINHMRHQVAQSSQTRNLTLKTPRQHSVRIAGITCEETPAIVCQPAESPFLD